MPQMMLISVVLPAPFGPEQRENLAAADLQVDALERLQPGGVGLDEVRDRNDRLHAKGDQWESVDAGAIYGLWPANARQRNHQLN